MWYKCKSQLVLSAIIYMPRQNQAARKQASRHNRRLKTCNSALASVIGLLQKLPLDQSLIDLDQHERLIRLRNERLSESVLNTFKTKSRPYPSTEFPISQADWRSHERKRIGEVKKVLEFDEAQYRRKYKRAQIEVLTDYIAKLGSRFAIHIFARQKPSAMSAEEMDRALARYNRYRFHHNFMAALVAVAETHQRGKISQFASALPSGAFIGPNGHFRPKLAPIVEALNGVEVDRIRMCGNKNCRRVFWAGRIAKPGSSKNNQLCCSPECSHAARNQRLRARYKDPRDDFASRKLTANEKWQSKMTQPKGK